MADDPNAPPPPNPAAKPDTPSLVEVENPAKVTDKQINEFTNDGLKQDGTAAADAAKTLAENRDAAKKHEAPDRGYFGGQGGAQGI